MPSHLGHEERAARSVCMRVTARTLAVVHTCVARGGLDESVARLNATGGLRVEDHLLPDAILDRPTRIHELTLGP